MEAIKTIDGTVEEIWDRLSSTGDTVVEIHIAAGGAREKCLAYAEKADILKNLHERMQGLVSRNGVSHIRELGVRLEISGIVKNQSNSKDIIVTGIKLMP